MLNSLETNSNYGLQSMYQAFPSNSHITFELWSMFAEAHDQMKSNAQCIFRAVDLQVRHQTNSPRYEMRMNQNMVQTCETAYFQPKRIPIPTKLGLKDVEVFGFFHIFPDFSMFFHGCSTQNRFVSTLFSPSPPPVFSVCSEAKTAAAGAGDGLVEVGLQDKGSPAAQGAERSDFAGGRF